MKEQLSIVKARMWQSNKCLTKILGVNRKYKREVGDILKING